MRTLLLAGSAGLPLAPFGATAALAQDISDGPPQSLPTSPASHGSTLPRQADGSAKLAEMGEELGLKGWATPPPKFGDTLTRDYRGCRSTLFDRDVPTAAEGLLNVAMFLRPGGAGVRWPFQNLSCASRTDDPAIALGT